MPRSGPTLLSKRTTSISRFRPCENCCHTNVTRSSSRLFRGEVTGCVVRCVRLELLPSVPSADSRPLFKSRLRPPCQAVEGRIGDCWAMLPLVLFAGVTLGVFFGWDWYQRIEAKREASEALERGEALMRARNPIGAVRELEEGLTKDSGNARIYGALAHAFAAAATSQASSAPRPAGQSPAVYAAERSVALDPTCGDCHGTLAMFLFYHEWQWALAEQHFTEAIRLAPDTESIRPAYAMYLALVGPDRRRSNRLISLCKGGRTRRHGSASARQFSTTLAGIRKRLPPQIRRCRRQPQPRGVGLAQQVAVSARSRRRSRTRTGPGSVP